MTDLPELPFVLALDGLKSVLRGTRLLDGSRFENSAEHSWHASLAALTLAPYAEEGTDVGRAVALLLVHDIGEIDAGDVSAYDEAALAEHAPAEARCVERLAGLLPAPQGSVVRELWEEFAAQETPEARYAAAIDRLMPMVLSFAGGGEGWREGHITYEKVSARAAGIAAGSPRLGEFAVELIAAARRLGYFATPSANARRGH